MHFSIQTMEYHVPNLYPQRENSPDDPVAEVCVKLCAVFRQVRIVRPVRVADAGIEILNILRAQHRLERGVQPPTGALVPLVLAQVNAHLHRPGIGSTAAERPGVGITDELAAALRDQIRIPGVLHRLAEGQGSLVGEAVGVPQPVQQALFLQVGLELFLLQGLPLLPQAQLGVVGLAGGPVILRPGLVQGPLGLGDWPPPGRPGSGRSVPGR